MPIALSLFLVFISVYLCLSVVSMLFSGHTRPRIANLDNQA